jgi:tetratricopeptide (TPR) repeat protein
MTEIHNIIADFNKNVHKYSLKQDAVNGVGWKLFKSKKYGMALAVFKFNVLRFSKSPFVYESLAEAHMKIGNKQKAIKNYKKLLELNPKSATALKMLKKLGQ